MDSRIFLSILFGLVFIISWLAQRTLSKNKFKKHVTCYYLDFIFLPFNILLPFAMVLNFSLLYYFVPLSVIGNMIFHFHLWPKIHKKEKTQSHIYKGLSNKLTLSGYVHLLFSMFETVLMMYFLFVLINGIVGYLEIILLGIFFTGVIILSRKIHKNTSYLDVLVGVGGLIIVLYKIFF